MVGLNEGGRYAWEAGVRGGKLGLESWRGLLGWLACLLCFTGGQPALVMAEKGGPW